MFYKDFIKMFILKKCKKEGCKNIKTVHNIKIK